MIPLKEVQPTGIVCEPRRGFPEFIENLLIRCFFEPYIKDKIGWIGISYRLGNKKSWTFKIKNQKGIYCLRFLDSRKKEDWFLGIFNLQYFPNKEEPVLDTFSMGENILRLDPQFDNFIRYVPEEKDPLEYAFTIGKIICSISSDEKNVLLSLLSPLRWRTIQVDGISIPDGIGRNVEAVAPFGLDRNVPAFKLGWKFFDKMVVTFCYQLKDSPDYVLLSRRQSRGLDIFGDGTCYPSERDIVKEYMLTIGLCEIKTKAQIDKIIRFAISFFPVFDFYPLSKEIERIWFYSKLIQTPLRGNKIWWETYKWVGSPEDENFYIKNEDVKPPLFIFTGFLGSGKTTLINNIAEYYSLQKNRFIAIIQNEIGKVDLDGTLIDSAVNITTLNDGCVCCTVRGELRSAIRQVCINYNPDMIILETTGLADPENILKEIPFIRPFVRFDSLITVVDGKNFERTLDEFPVVKSQIKKASLIILTKTDMIDDVKKEFVMKMLKKHNENAPILEGIQGRINPSILLSFGEDIDLEKKVDNFNSDFADRILHHIEGLQIANIHFSGVLSKEIFFDFLKRLPKSIYRIKGVVNIKEYKVPQLIQYVGGHYEITNFLKKDIEPNTLVFIGYDFKKENIEKELRSIIANN